MKRMTVKTQNCFILWKLFLVLPALVYTVGLKLSAYLYDHERVHYIGQTSLWEIVHEASFWVLCMGQFLCWFFFIWGCLEYRKHKEEYRDDF